MSSSLTVYEAIDWYDANGYPTDTASMDAYFDTNNVILFDSIGLFHPPIQKWPDSYGPLGSSVKFGALVVFNLTIPVAGEYQFAVDGDAIWDAFMDDALIVSNYEPLNFPGELDVYSSSVSLSAGSHVLQVRLVNGITTSGFGVWCKLPGVNSWEPLPLELYSDITPNLGFSSGAGVALLDEYPSGPHRLAGQTLLEGTPVRRRVEVRKRRTGDYVISAVTDDGDGTFEFRHLPTQTLADPYTVTCYDDNKDEHGNALIFDRVYQVDENGNPPQT